MRFCIDLRGLIPNVLGTIIAFTRRRMMINSNYFKWWAFIIIASNPLEHGFYKYDQLKVPAAIFLEPRTGYFETKTH